MHPRNEEYFRLLNSKPRDDAAIRAFWERERRDFQRQARALMGLLAFCAIGWTVAFYFLVMR